MAVADYKVGEYDSGMPPDPCTSLNVSSKMIN